MRWILLSLFVSCSSFAASSSLNDLTPALVRIRMQKDIEVFPIVSGSSFKKIGERIWRLHGEKLIYAGKNLPPNNYIIKREDGKFDIIGVVGFNDYLTGVVANEMPLNWPIEALKSQAVVARSYALAKISERKNATFQLESNQADQVFSSSISARAKQAVLSTQGVVLLRPDGNVLKAFYHSDCGGQTVSASSVWGAQTFDSGTAKDPWCASRKSNQWNFEISRADFFNRLGVSDTGVDENQHYTRKEQLIAVGEQFFPVQKLREIFGFFKIKSAVDNLEIMADTVKINGQGFGHGAGLCQWGTLAQAKLGKTYIQVLEHYYSKAKIVQNNYRLSFNLPLNLAKKTVSN
jgi:stage II sporulation protein D